ncbi:MAG: hypothetical protein IKW92_08275 [Firmicutes bacterium]|nr:hypothetical protein [Bacillota bacterium]
MKNKRRYCVCCEIWDEESICCPCYGLECDGFVIHFISTDRVFVEMVASILNRLGTEPHRAPDIIEQLLP